MTCVVDTPHLLMEMRHICYRSDRLDSKNNKDKSGLSPSKHFSLFQSLQVRLTFSSYFVPLQKSEASRSRIFKLVISSVSCPFLISTPFLLRICISEVLSFSSSDDKIIHGKLSLLSRHVYARWGGNSTNTSWYSEVFLVFLRLLITSQSYHSLLESLIISSLSSVGTLRSMNSLNSS